VPAHHFSFKFQQSEEVIVMASIRVVLVDDHPVVLAGVKALLQSASEFEVIGEAVSGEAALELISQARPDVAVIDISMPDLNGLELAERLAATCPEVKLLAQTVHEDQAYVQRLLQLGVRGYILKRSAAEGLVQAVRAIVTGGVYLDPAVAEKALAPSVHQVAGVDGAGKGEELSPREQDVLKLTAQGYTNKEIAARLEVGVKSVETYKARATAKLNLRTRAEIVRYAFSQNWTADLDRS
jgi:DNA-binding NarL/FixJ family response regulator